MNTTEEIWGPDGKEFKPERWLVGSDGEEGLPESARMIQGYHHVFTFSDGPRLCLGRNFAVANFKVGVFVFVFYAVYVFIERTNNLVGTCRRLSLCWLGISRSSCQRVLIRRLGGTEVFCRGPSWRVRMESAHRCRKIQPGAPITSSAHWHIFCKNCLT